MNVRLVVFAALTLVACVLVPTLNAGEQLTMRVSPFASFAPADVRVRLGVEPHENNRWLTVVAESDEFYRSSEFPLDAENSPRTIAMLFRGLPGGRYVVRGNVRDASGRERAAVRQEVVVLPLASNR